MSTAKEIMMADLKESTGRHRQYWQSSNLPVMERHYNKPEPRKYPRDKALKRIMSMELHSTMRRLWQEVEGEKTNV